MRRCRSFLLPSGPSSRPGPETSFEPRLVFGSRGERPGGGMSVRSAQQAFRAQSQVLGLHLNFSFDYTCCFPFVTLFISRSDPPKVSSAFQRHGRGAAPLGLRVRDTGAPTSASEAPLSAPALPAPRAAGELFSHPLPTLYPTQLSPDLWGAGTRHECLGEKESTCVF